MIFKRPRRSDLDLNITPLIDVVFLLLIFLMLTTSFLRPPALQVELPEARGDSPLESASQIEVLVSAEGSYRIADRMLPDHKVTTLMGVIGELSPDRAAPLVISADAMAPHQAVVRVMDAARRLEMNHLSVRVAAPQETPEEVSP